MELNAVARLDAVSWNFILTGFAVVTISVIALFRNQLWQKWADLVVGIWLASSPKSPCQNGRQWYEPRPRGEVVS
ncbi:SPW repeat domain-containing protein [Phyllobacterium sp. LjRoot231]|uniref:SPW repeat domain-containing protein n=1 Tax=Phyllobacterium sp. LjRoot231 TaxID=3342289 RepID=UPI003F5082AA